MDETRMMKETLLALLYARLFDHGTNGHVAYHTIAAAARTSMRPSTKLLVEIVDELDLDVDGIVLAAQSMDEQEPVD